MIRRMDKEKGMRMKKGIGVAAVIAVAMAILLIAFSLAPLASASAVKRTFDIEGGKLYYKGTLPDDANHESISISVYKGEEIYFENTTIGLPVAVIVSGPYYDDGDKKSGCKDYSVKVNESWDSSGMKTEYFYKVVEENTTVGCWFGIVSHSFELELEKEKVQEGESFDLELKTNNKEGGVMKLGIEEDKFAIMNVDGRKIKEIPVGYNETGFAEYVDVEGIEFKNGTLVFDTTKLNMKEEEYKIILEDYATEVEKKVDIKVEKIYLKVECEEKEVVKGDDIVIKIESSFFEREVNVTVEGIYDEPLNLTLDKDGKEKVRISTESDKVKYGKHKITVKVCGTTEKKIKYVTIKKGGASLEEIPEDATVGDVIPIEGASDFGDFAVFVIEDVFKGEARISDKKFEWDWDTEEELDGYHGIEVFILREDEYAEFSDNYSIGDVVDEIWQRRAGVDASADIFLLLPEFSMTVSKNIAEEDDVVISGTAKGTDHVYVIVMNHKGEVMFPPDGTTDVIKARTTSVEGEEWEENIGELDSGRYTVIALYEGKDGVTDAIKDLGKPNAEWAAGDESKTLEQRVAILMDALTSAGSDDLFEKVDFSVSAPKVILKEPKTVVEIGDEITVKAETNIKNGAKAFISLSQNLSILKKTFTLVENGCVNASINTSGLQPGSYNVAVDVSGRASDEKVVTLVEKKEVVEEGKEEIAQNESLAEPGTVEEVNESVGEGEFLNESREGGEEEERKIPVNVWDLVIAVIVAISISFAAKRKRY